MSNARVLCGVAETLAERCGLLELPKQVCRYLHVKQDLLDFVVAMDNQVRASCALSWIFPQEDFPHLHELVHQWEMVDMELLSPWDQLFSKMNLLCLKVRKLHLSIIGCLP